MLLLAAAAIASGRPKSAARPPAGEAGRGSPTSPQNAVEPLMSDRRYDVMCVEGGNVCVASFVVGDYLSFLFNEVCGVRWGG